MGVEHFDGMISWIWELKEKKEQSQKEKGEYPRVQSSLDILK